MVTLEPGISAGAQAPGGRTAGPVADGDAQLPGGTAAVPVSSRRTGRVTGDPTAAAFFDVDNTIVQGASIFHLARGLYRRDFLSMRDILRFAWQQAKFVALGENTGDVADVQARALAFIAGHSVSEMRAVGEEVYDEMLADKIWPGTLALARMHEDAGQRVWLVTATPIEVAEVIAARLGLSGALGTVSEHIDGIYTGQLVGQPMHGQAKAKAVAELAEREGLALRRCAAYSDSANDIPLLSLVGHPVAVNPDSKLRAHARAHGWQIQDYRTKRRVAKIGLPSAGLGVAAGFLAGALAARNRYKTA